MNDTTTPITEGTREPMPWSHQPWTNGPDWERCQADGADWPCDAQVQRDRADALQDRLGAAERARLESIDVERLADALRDDVVQDAIQRWMPTDQTSHVAKPLAAEYTRLIAATPEPGAAE